MIGWPVEHSRSPAIHNAAAAAAGVDLVYVALRVKPGDGAAAAASMRTLGIRGLSVTMPHKVDVIDALDELTDVARTLGAVNHITNTDGHLVGNNTDGAGFVAGLKFDAGIDLDAKTVGVFGSGSAAKAIVLGCANAGAQVVVVGRDSSRAQKAAEVAGDRASVGSLSDLAGVDVAVNATPIGMERGEGAGEVPFDVAMFGPETAVVDIVYTPLETALLRSAANRGLATVDGLSMLVGQAGAQFEAWTGAQAPLQAMREAARH